MADPIIIWKSGLQIEQDPQDNLDYEIDLIPFLRGGTVATADVIPNKCTAVIRTISATGLVVRVGAVVRGSKITIDFLTNNGQNKQFSILFEPTQQ